MNNKNVNWIKKNLICVVFFCILALVCFILYQAHDDCESKAGEWNHVFGYCEKSLGFKGVFAYNSIYNTCSYYDLNGGKLFFDGYCYESYDKPDRLVEACVTGCLLEQPYEVEDRNWCVDNCKINLINNYKLIIN